MEQYLVQTSGEAPLIVGAYGFTLIFTCSPIVFKDDVDSEVTIRISKKSGTVIEKKLTVVNFEDGVFSWVVSEDVFTEPGTYSLQLVQTGEGYRIKSAITKVPVEPDLA